MARILIVDDDELVRETLVGMLATAGHEVDAVEDGNPAAPLLLAGTYDAVVTDVLMPGKEGVALILELRRAGFAGAIVAMSGGGRLEAGDVLKIARKAGADACLTKPFRRRELLTALETCLALRR